MKYLILLTMFVGSWAMAQADGRVVEGTIVDGIHAETNYVKNPSCRRNANDIVAVGGTVAKSVVTPLEKTSECLVTSGAAAETFTWATRSLDQQLNSRTDCAVQFVYEGAGCNNFTASVRIGGVDAGGFPTALSAAANPVKFKQTYACGTLASATDVRITSSAAGSCSIAKLYIGADPSPSSAGGTNNNEFTFELAGPYGQVLTASGAAPYNDQARFVAPFNLKITDVCMTVRDAPGTTETFDFKHAAKATPTAFSSIFTTTPKWNASTANGELRCMSVDSGSGQWVSPTMTSFPYNMSVNDVLRLDVLAVAASGSEGTYITIKYEPQ